MPTTSSDNHTFTRQELVTLLDAVVEKTLGQVDSANVFEKAVLFPKVTGIAGNVIEQSVLGYPPNSSPDADLLVDGVPVELKTTGIRYSKEDKKVFEAKEPMTITAVSLPKDDKTMPIIIDEEFSSSHFWKKAENLLMVLYHYDSSVTVKASDYASFLIKGYLFNKFNEEDKLRLQNDWLIVRNFIAELYSSSDTPTKEYPRLSSELRTKLVYIDTAPKYPNPPRFRLKRALVSKIVQDYFESKKKTRRREVLDGYISYDDIDRKCREIERKFSGKKLADIYDELGLEKKFNKNTNEVAIVRMFGGQKRKLNEIEMIKSFGLIAKTITLTEKGARTEDMKLFGIDFNEWSTPDLNFEESPIYSYFAEHQFLFILFEEPSQDAPLEENVFVGFRRYWFSDEFIEKDVRKTWNEVRDLVINNKLREIPSLDRNNNPILNKTGVAKVSINFPKSSKNNVFVRGGGIDSSHKTENVNGIQMYKQYIWIKGSWIADIISRIQTVKEC